MLLSIVLFGSAQAAPGPCPKTLAEIPLPPAVQRTDPRLVGPALIVVEKENRRIYRFQDGVLAPGACWRVGLGFGPVGHKKQRGDGKTPQGWYRTSDKPWSQFYAAIAVHYPNLGDTEEGVARGRVNSGTLAAIQTALEKDMKPPQQTLLGGEILIHGGGSATDWTLGCIAMENTDIDALRAGLPPSMKTDVLILK